MLVNTGNFIRVRQLSEVKMADYKEMYFELAAKLNDAIDLLIMAQRNTENEYCRSKTKIKKQTLKDK